MKLSAGMFKYRKNGKQCLLCVLIKKENQHSGLKAY
jgi:hypothetical protein